MKDALAAALDGSSAQELAVYLLGNVPGLPPITQSFHILGIAVVVGTIVMIDLRLLGMAVPTQRVSWHLTPEAAGPRVQFRHTGFVRAVHRS